MSFPDWIPSSSRTNTIRRVQYSVFFEWIVILLLLRSSTRTAYATTTSTDTKKNGFGIIFPKRTRMSFISSSLLVPEKTGRCLNHLHPFGRIQQPNNYQQQQKFTTTFSTTAIQLTYNMNDSSPSDYDINEIGTSTQPRRVTVAGGDTSSSLSSSTSSSGTGTGTDDDSTIRDALKQELILLSSITNRGEYATMDEQNLLVDIVAQLEALNPSSNPIAPAGQEGIWDLCLSSTQLFRSSPFFQSIRSAFDTSNDANNIKASINNAFDIHDRATTASRIGRIRQIIDFTSSSSGGEPSIISEVDLEVGVVPGFPFRVKGTVVTKAIIKNIRGIDTYEIQIVSTSVQRSNIPFFNQLLDELKFELPIGEFYQRTIGKNPTIINKTFYLDDSMRITRDQDDNFFIYTRA